MKLRRFPPPWSIEDIGAAFVVKDGGGQKLVYIYFDNQLAAGHSEAKLLKLVKDVGDPG